VNTQGVLHILEAMRKTARHLPLVYASSAAVYGNTCDLPCRDDVPLARALLSPYALQKLQAEDYALLYAKSHHLPSLGLRYFNVYGTRQDPHSSYSGVISRFLAAYRQQENFKVFGDGLQLRDFIAVQDVAAANLLALESGYHGVLNIATGVPHSVLNLVDFFCGIEQKNIKVDFLPERSGDIQASYGSNTLALQHLGFSYHTDLQTGIKSLVL
jgi:UDP-glucose 4-epimerase